MDVPENATVWEITEPSKEFKVERSHDLSVIDWKIAKLEELIEGLSKTQATTIVGTGAAILNVETSSVRKKYEAMLSAEEHKRRETLKNESRLDDDYKGFEERVAFIEKAKSIIQEDTYIMDEILSHHSGEIAIDYYNCEPERESLEQIVAHISEHVEGSPEITEGKRYLTYHIKSESGKDLFMIYSQESGFKILKDDFGGKQVEEISVGATEKAPAEQPPVPVESKSTEQSSADFAIDKLVYQLIFEAFQTSFPNKRELNNISFYETYSKLQKSENIKEKLSKLFEKMDISSSKDSRTMMASPLENKVVTVFDKLVDKASIKEELKKLETWFNDDKTLDKKSMSGSAITLHNAIAFDARKSIESKEEAYRLFSTILGYHHFFDTNFSYVVDNLRENGEALFQQRNKDTAYYIKPCPPVPLYKELTNWRNEALKTLLVSLREMKLQGAKKAEKERIVKSIQTLADQMEQEVIYIKGFNIDKLLGKDHFKDTIIELEKRTKALAQ